MFAVHKIGGPSFAVLDKEDYGIQFGAEELTIALLPGEEKRAKSRLGCYYAKLPTGGRSLFSTDEKLNKVALKKLLVYVAEGLGDEWQLDGITWKTKRVIE